MMFPPDGCQEKEEPRDSFFRGFFRLELSLYQGVTKKKNSHMKTLPKN